MANPAGSKRKSLMQVYNLLLSEFGKQNWWPTTLEGELHPAYHGNGMSEKQKFEVVVGAILTQNTSWKNVEKAIFSLNKEAILGREKIMQMKKQRLAMLIKPSGYYNQKAERLKAVAGFLAKNPNPSRKELLEVKGIGPETADSILLYAFGKPFFVVDAYTKRIFSRMGFCEGKCGYDELQGMFHESLKKNAKLFNEYHALIVELAKQHCRKKPECRGCPVSALCEKII